MMKSLALKHRSEEEAVAATDVKGISPFSRWRVTADFAGDVSIKHVPQEFDAAYIAAAMHKIEAPKPGTSIVTPLRKGVTAGAKNDDTSEP